MSKQLKPVPEFANEAEERAFWEAPGERQHGVRGLEQGKGGDVSQTEAIHGNHLHPHAGGRAEYDSRPRAQTRCAVPIANQALVRREDRRSGAAADCKAGQAVMANCRIGNGHREGSEARSSSSPRGKWCSWITPTNCKGRRSITRSEASSYLRSPIRLHQYCYDLLCLCQMEPFGVARMENRRAQCVFIVSCGIPTREPIRTQYSTAENFPQWESRFHSGRRLPGEQLIARQHRPVGLPNDENPARGVASQYLPESFDGGVTLKH